MQPAFVIAKVILASALLSGCTVSQRVHVNRVGAALTTASLGADWCTTRAAATADNPLWTIRENGHAQVMIGDRPTVRQVDTYFAITTVVVVAAAQLIPEQYRWMLYAGVASVETQTTLANVRVIHVMGASADCTR